MEFKSLKEKYEYYRSLSDYRLEPQGYVMVMLDGRAFSTRIKKLFDLPFDEEFIRMMNETAKFVCMCVSGCKMAYVQSDEITIVIYNGEGQSPMFENRLCKLQSIIASLATAKFNQLMTMHNLSKIDKCDKEGVINMIHNMPLYEFDCKAWNLPSIEDVVASVLYRQNDCTRNSKNGFAQYFLCQSFIKRKKSDELVAILAKDGIEWEKLSDGEKYGRFITKKVTQYFSDTGGPYTRTNWDIMEAFQLNTTEGRTKLKDFIEKKDEVCGISYE